MLKRYFLLVLGLCAATAVHCQVNSCGTDLMNQQFGEQHPERLAYRSAMQELIRTGEGNTERNTLVIPTVVHVLHMGGPEKISETQIHDGLRVLNEDLRRMNSDTGDTRSLFKPYGADLNVEFRLAKIDPDGNCTNGITYTFSELTMHGDDAVKQSWEGGVDAWPVNKYFNIWVVNRIQIGTDNVIGYAYFPSWGMSDNYGVVIDNNYFGTIEAAQSQDGRTLTHEVGHCLELYHTFQSGCGTNCSNSGDDVCDTPPVTAASFSCSYALNTCTNDASGPSPYAGDVADMIENYMSYNQGFCQNIFTKGQKIRSDNALQNTFINQLYTAQNLTATGTTDGFENACTLEPDFKWSRAAICVGDSVLFTDQTHNGTPQTYQWNVSGPQNFTSNVANPVFVFNQTGLYSVSLSVSNAAGTQSITQSHIVRVSDTTNTGFLFYDGFDNQPLETGRWVAKNFPYGSGWEEKITATGNYTVYIHNITNDNEYMAYELYSPVYNLSLIEDPKLNFKTAYAQLNSSSSDRMKVYFSVDCGATWIPRLSKTGVGLASMSITGLDMEPNLSSDWAQWEIDVPTSMEGATDFMVKFGFETGVGNNFYLDDINIAGLSGIDENTVENIVQVYPNPSADVFTIALPSMEFSGELEIVDMNGRLVFRRQMNETKLSLSGKELLLKAGIYRIRIVSTAQVYTGKIIITR